MEFTTQDLKALFNDIADLMARERDNLCALDGVIGDADHGIAMEQGMKAATASANAVEAGTMKDLFNAAAKGFLNAVGASSGPLYATAFMQAGKELGAVESIPKDDLRKVVKGMNDGIARRGKAEPGQKTMIDAWHPAAMAASNGATPDEIVAAAHDGANKTKNMVAQLGRAARLGERSLGHPDPGAVSAVMIIGQICKYM